MKNLLFILIFSFESCSFTERFFGSISSSNTIQLAFANFLARYNNPSSTPTPSPTPSPPAKTCIKVATKTQSTNQTTGETNTTTCKFDYSTISNLCTNEKPILESEIQVNQKRTYFKSVEDFIKQKEIFAKNFQTFEIYNEDNTKKKQFYYDNDKRYRILEFDGGESIYTEFDSKNRPTKGKLIAHCEVPIDASYDDQNNIFSVNIYFSQSGPDTNNYCLIYRSLIQNQNLKFEFNQEFLKVRDTITVGNSSTIINYNNIETEEVCTGTSTGTSFTENLEPAEVTSIETENILPGAAAGEFIILRGKNFNPNFSNNQVQFHQKIPVTPVSGDTSFIRVQIPPNARSGRILVNNGKAKSYSPNFIVYKYFLFIADTGNNQVLVYNMNALDGSLVSFQTLSSSSTVRSFAVTPNGKNLYISKNSGLANMIERRKIEIDSIPPFLQKISTTSLENFGDDGNPKLIAIDPKGEFLFVYHESGTPFNFRNQLRKIDSDGSTSFLSNFNVVNSSGEFSIHPTKKNYYITSGSMTNVRSNNFDNNTISEIAIPINTLTTPNFGAIHPNGNYYYIATSGASAGIRLYSIDSIGSLSLINTYNTVTSGHFGIAIDNKGKFLVTASDVNDTIKSFQINSDFSLSTPISTITITDPKKLIFDPSGRFVYSFRDTTPYSLYIYSVNQTTGALTAVSNSITFSSPQNILFAKIPQ